MKHKVLIFVSGGVVQDVMTNGETEVHLFDADNHEAGDSPRQSAYPHQEMTDEKLMEQLAKEQKKRCQPDMDELLNGWREQFGPDFKVPAVLDKHKQFEDKSWGNDICPSFAPVVNGKALNTIALWSDHPKDAMRECPGGKRFWVSTYEEDGSWIGDGFETDNIQEAIAKALELAGVK